jgi:hypothetical protein
MTWKEWVLFKDALTGRTSKHHGSTPCSEVHAAGGYWPYFDRARLAPKTELYVRTDSKLGDARGSVWMYDKTRKVWRAGDILSQV